jgi:photosystem II stability/assembly factor-like uncharacterized protein
MVVRKSNAKKIDNPVVLGRLEWYAKQINYAAKNKIGGKATKQEWKDILEGRISKGVKAGGPLLTTTWDQPSPYNKFCPADKQDPSKKALVGCVAVAMSQIMRYHQWPTSGKGWYKYLHPDFGVQYANFENTNYDWSNMPNKLTSSNTTEEIDAVATLCYHAGVSVDMGYGIESSGAYSLDVTYALTNYFNYDPTTIKYLSFDNFSESGWIDIIKSEIDAGRPIYYSGSSQQSGGHAFVCDGYNTDNQIHINWGWSGYADGYYVVTSLKPNGTSYDFSNNNNIIIGIQPNSTSYINLWTRQASGFSTDNRGIQFISAVNNRVAWAIAYDGNNNPSTNIKEYTMTTDGGATWTAGLINTTGADQMAAVMISAVDDKTAWVLLNDYQNYGGMILKTINSGRTWNNVTSEDQFLPSNGGLPRSIYFWDNNTGVVIGDPTNGYFEIYTTTNGGDSWERVPEANIPSIVTDEYGTSYFNVIGDTIWFATNKGRIFRSTNNGNNWEAFQTPFSTVGFNIAFKNNNFGIIYGNENGTDKFYSTDNAGESWTEFTPSGDVYTYDFCWIPGTDTLIATGANITENKSGVSYSVDNGLTFVDYSSCYKNFQFTKLGVSPNGSVWAGGFNWSPSYGGIWHKGNKVLSGNFFADQIRIYKNTTVNFTETIFGTPESLDWNFGEGAEPATANGNGPHAVKYTTAGKKTVTLTIQKGNDIQVITKKDIVNVFNPTAIYDNEATKYSVYPNPTNSSVIVNINGFTKGKIDIYNITGALVWSSGAITNDGRIDVSNLNPGVYLIKIQDEKGKIATKKLTISR